MTTTKPQSTTEDLEPCPWCKAVPEQTDLAPSQRYRITHEPTCFLIGRLADPQGREGRAHYIPLREVSVWNSCRISPASAAPVVDNVGLNLLRQLVGGKNSLRTLGVFPCNQAEHEDVDCECFWEQCEAWARQDAGIAPVDHLVCAKCGKPREGVSAESFLCRYCFSTESTAVPSSASPVEQTVYVSEHPVTLHCNTCGLVRVKSFKCPRGDGQLVVGAAQ